MFVLAQSHARIHKERAMRRRKLKWLWARLKQIAAMDLDREGLPMKLSAMRGQARAAWRFIDVEAVSTAPRSASHSIAKSCAKCGGAKDVISCAPIGPSWEPAELWQFYIQLVEVEAAFIAMKDDLQLRPIDHQLEERIEAHIFVAFLADLLHVMLRARLEVMAEASPREPCSTNSPLSRCSTFTSRPPMAAR